MRRRAARLARLAQRFPCQSPPVAMSQNPARDDRITAAICQILNGVLVPGEYPTDLPHALRSHVIVFAESLVQAASYVHDTTSAEIQRVEAWLAAAAR